MCFEFLHDPQSFGYVYGIIICKWSLGGDHFFFKYMPTSPLKVQIFINTKKNQILTKGFLSTNRIK